MLIRCRQFFHGRRQRPPAVLWLLLAALAVGWGGCSNPEKRYQVLSFFFDGVPNPNQSAGRSTTRGPKVLQDGGSAVVVHKPYTEGKCEACHGKDRRLSIERAQASCVGCHAESMKKYPFMHAAIASSACLWCHAPHESTFAHLLRDSPSLLCDQCHDRALLPSFPAQHAQVDSDCAQCHMSHGGDDHRLLKPGAATQPTTAPTAALFPRAKPPGSAEPNAGGL